MQLERPLSIYKIVTSFIYILLITTAPNIYGKCTSIQTLFTSSETIICGPGSKVISFINSSTGDEATTGDYTWYMNGVPFDKTSGLNPPLTSTVSETGTYAYMLVATDKSGCKDTAIVNVHIYPIPVANFTIPGNGCGNTTLTFKNISSGTGTFTAYNWDFGDGSKSIDANPTHTYSSVKSYTISLTVSNGTGCTNVFKDTVTISPGPEALAEGKDKDGDTKYCLSLNDSISSDTVYFFNYSTNAQSYRWDFGDGSPLLTTISTEKIMHVYTSYGTFKVTLLAISPDGCEKSKTITVIFNRSVNAALSLLPSELSGCMPHQVMPVNKSSGADGYVWNFGDGTPVVNIANAIPFGHIYAKKGIYVISLKAFNSCNSISILSDTIRVGATPVSKFTVTPVTGCAPQEVNFNNTTISTATNYHWYFGDSTDWNGAANPANKFYKEGKWKISLIASNNCGSDTSSTTITINAVPVSPVVKEAIVCSGSNVKLEVTGTPGIYEWFDSSINGKLLSTGAIYTTPPLTASTTFYVQSKFNNCISRRVPVKVTILPLPDKPEIAGVSICKGNTAILEASAPGKYEWYTVETGGTWVDTTASFITPPLIVNTDYYVQRTIAGCTSKRSVVKVKVNDPPKASFKADVICLGQPTPFTDFSTEHLNTWLWNFGDGSKSTTGPAISHTYSRPGSYIVELTVSNGMGCTDSVLQVVVVNDTIKVSIISVDSACMYEPLALKDNSIMGNDSIVSSIWDFGDNTSFDKSLNATHFYSKAGTYQITHHVTSDKGCSSFANTFIYIVPQPVADFSSINTCQIQQSIFTDLSKDEIISWEWDFGDGHKSTQQHPQHPYAVSGYFMVKLVAKTTIGCSDTVTRQIFVYPQPIANFTADTVCWGDTTTFKNTSLSVDGSIDKVYWNFDDGTISDDFNPAHVFVSEKDAFNVALMILTSHGCKDTLRKLVNTNPLPVFHFFPKEKVGCEVFTTEFMDSSTVAGGKIMNWLWDFGDGNKTYRKHPTHSFDQAGNYYVSLKVTSSYGCQMFDTLDYPITVLPKPEAGFTATPDDMSIDQPTVQFMDHSTDGTMWDWDFGDHKTNITRNPFHTYTDTGTFTVTQIVINAFGCNDTATATVRINAQPALFIPNAFSPDGNNLNDTFVPVGNGITDFNMLIFDRWGKKIFETTDFNSGWNGKVSGSDELAKEDIYIYKISMKDVLQKVRHYTGSVMLTTQ